MNKLNFVNLGCGSHFHPDWINIDFVSNSPEVIAHNLLDGIPLQSNSVDVVYHSHVLEHFPKDKAANFLEECFRILKPGGIIRIAIPDLQQIISQYIRIVSELNSHPDDKNLWADYDWIMLELYDQTVRNVSGGNMAKYLTDKNLVNKKFVIERCGDEVKRIMDLPEHPEAFKQEKSKKKSSIAKELYRLLRYGNRRKRLIHLLLGEEYNLLKIGRFRVGGEIHQWMYDRYSLARLLENTGFINYEVKTAFESSILNWVSYNLDGKIGIVRKPDSLFCEAKKISSI